MLEVSWNLKEFCPRCSPVGRGKKRPFFWVGDAGYSRGISSACKGSRSEAPRSEGF